jgi:hypothetical protein
VSEEAIKIFYSYSRKDLNLRNTLEDHLSALREAKRIETWHDLELEAGTEWEPVILHKLDTADIILLLISSSFLASKYCYGTELKRAIARHDAGTARVIPIILRPCDWNHDYVPFSKLNVLPTHATPITKWEDRDEAFAIVAQRIRETVDQLNAKKLAERQAAEQQQLLAQKEEAQRAERERLQREQQAVEQEQQRQAEQLKRETEAAEQQRQELERQRRKEELRQKLTVKADELASEKGIDYTRLRDLLKAGQWQEADQETADRMCEVMGRQKERWLRVEDIQNFSSTDLCTIDRLWIKHSQGRFGFSVQKKTWQVCGSPTEYNTNWEKFGKAVGWKKKVNWINYSEVTFDTSAPNGHLPYLGVGRVGVTGFVGMVWWVSLLSRRDL